MKSTGIAAHDVNIVLVKFMKPRAADVPEAHKKAVESKNLALETLHPMAVLEDNIGSKVCPASETGDSGAPCFFGKAVVQTYLHWLQATGVAEPEDRVSIA